METMVNIANQYFIKYTPVLHVPALVFVIAAPAWTERFCHQSVVKNFWPFVLSFPRQTARRMKRPSRLKMRQLL
jgi:hypothetical protein